MQNSQTIEKFEELIEKAKNGDVHAFGKIVNEHRSFAYAVAFRFLYDEHDAEDVVQESFIRIWNHLRDIDPNKKFTTWMYKIVVNLCYDKAKSNKRRNRIFERLTSNIVETKCDSEVHLEEEFTTRETVEFIKYFADGLSQKQRMIFLLRDMQGQSVEEVSAITGLSESAIKTNLFFARQNIRKKLIQLESNV
jgi:RNA polymerase sigma-70 factor (ECF subfamily)